MTAIICAITSKGGHIYYGSKQGYFNSNDTINFLEFLLSKNPNKQVVVFWDNASIHKSRKVTAYIETKPNLTALYNMEYEPELNGIETLWNVLKARFRTCMT